VSDDQPRAVATPRIVRLMRKAGWNRAHGTIRRRLYDLAMDRRPWWDWGNRVMTLTGSDFGGQWQTPTPPTWWYRQIGTKRMWRTGFRRLTAGLNEDGMYEWSAINANQDGDLHLGKRYWGGTFYDLPSREVPVLRRYLLRWWLLDWFGARPWLYSQGLNAAVYVRRPGSCQQAPPKGLGGYDHWLCQKDRGHAGHHVFRSYEWDGSGRRVARTEAASDA
jgi:hypothetical protein